MLNELINLANYLDESGFKKEADRVDVIIKRCGPIQIMEQGEQGRGKLELGPPEGEGFSPEHCKPGDWECYIEQTSREKIKPGHYGWANLPMREDDILAADFPNAPEWQAAGIAEDEMVEAYWARQDQVRNSEETRERYRQYIASDGKEDFHSWIQWGEGEDHYFGKSGTKRNRENWSLQLNGVFFGKPWAIPDRLSPYLDLTPNEFTKAIRAGIEDAKRELDEGDTLEDIARLANKDLSNIPGLLEFEYSNKDVKRIKELLDDTVIRITEAADDGCSELRNKGAWSAGQIPNGVLADHEICINIFHWIYRFDEDSQPGLSLILTQYDQGMRQFVPEIKETAYHEAWHAILEFALYIAKYEGLAETGSTPLDIWHKPEGYAPWEGSAPEYYSLFADKAWEVADHDAIQNKSAWIKKGLEFLGCVGSNSCSDGDVEYILEEARELATRIWNPSNQEDSSHTVIHIKQAKRALERIGFSGETMSGICNVDGGKVYDLTFYGQLAQMTPGTPYSTFSEEQAVEILAVVLGIDCVNGDPEAYDLLAKLDDVEQVSGEKSVPV